MQILIIVSKSSTVIIPKSYKQALASPDAERWKLSMGEEIKALQDNFFSCRVTKGRTLVGGRWVYAIKSGPDGGDVFKVRYVEKGLLPSIWIRLFWYFFANH